MAFLFTYIPKWFQKLYKGPIWSIETSKKEVFLTFDDGPTPEITPWVLDQLKKHKAKATFFCIGKNIVAHPEITKRILKEGHRIGNHTYNHVNGWNTKNESYLEEVEKTQQVLKELEINTKLFRPPYGKIGQKQLRTLLNKDFKVILWNVLSVDYDTSISPEKCTHNVLKNSSKGAIIVYHDSIKASKNLTNSLPKILQHFYQKGYECNTLY